MSKWYLYVKRWNKYITLEHCVIRFIMAWCFISVIQSVYLSIYHNYKINEINFTGYMGFVPTFLLIVLSFMLLYIILEIGRRRNYSAACALEKIFLLLVTLSYAVICVVSYTDLYFCIGITALLAFSVCYCVKDMDLSKIEVSKRAMYMMMIILGTLFVVFTGGCTVLRYLSFAAPNFDFGLFSQMFHYMKTTLTMNTTAERDMLLSHFAVHISPAFYFLLPFYAIVTSPATLQLMQAVVIAMGLVPLAAICRNHKLSNLETILIGIAYVTYPVMSAGCFYDIHENLFLPLFLLMFLYFSEREDGKGEAGSLKGMIISMLLVFSVKEDASVYIVFIALYLILGRKMYRKGLLVLSCALMYFAFTTVLLSVIGEGVKFGRLNNMLLDENGSMLGIIQTVIMYPAYTLTQIFREDNIKFILQTLGPLLFMPLFSKKWYRFILIGPFVLFNLLPEYSYSHNIFFQYVFGSGTLLLYLSVINVADMDKKIRNSMVPMLSAACILFFSSIMLQKANIFQTYNKESNQEIYAVMNEGLSMIPEDASVIATTYLCAALSDRDILYELYYTDEEAEYVALDLRGEPKDYSVDTYLEDDKYETIYYSAERIAVFRNVHYSQN